MKALVVGGTGFIGGHLARCLAQRGDEIHLSTIDPPIETYPESATIHDLDITHFEAVQELIGRLQPDALFHLAAESNVPAVSADPLRAIRINIVGTAHVFEALHATNPEARAVFVSSAAVYDGADRDRCPWDETTPPAPRNLYASTKLSGEALVQGWVAERKQSIAIVRPFNQIGPGQSPRFAISSFSRAAAAIALGHQAPRIEVGNLEPKRDFCDVRDMVVGLVAALEHGPPGSIYNLASGRAHRIGDLLDRILELAGVESEIVATGDRLRPQDASVSAGDAGRATRELGWTPRIDIDQTLRDCLHDWKERLTPEVEPSP